MMLPELLHDQSCFHAFCAFWHWTCHRTKWPLSWCSLGHKLPTISKHRNQISYNLGKEYKGSLFHQGKISVELLGENPPSGVALPTFLCRNEPFFSPDEWSREGTEEASHQKNAERSPKSCGLEIRQKISCGIVCFVWLLDFPSPQGLWRLFIQHNQQGAAGAVAIPVSSP